ncbi:type IX secretion system outer membrane channel protein PorV [Flavobacteriaceae bacterium]|nr:type IX secretion system outer membrane channel protein PorV [Flavobacteriaceae bacterium]
MRNFILIFLTGLTFICRTNAQESTVIVPNPNDTRVITTGTAFMQIAGDARAAGMGDQGVATAPDAFSQQWNISKYAFLNADQGFSFTYTPYLSALVNDIFLGGLTYYNKLDDRSAISGGFRYFSLGEIQFTDENGVDLNIEKPNEFTFDIAYSLKLSDHFSMGVGLKYIRSDLKLDGSTIEGATAAGPASSFAVDIGGYYESDEKAYESFNGKWRGGFALQNIGPKIKYEEDGDDSFLPTTLRLGGGFDFILDGANKIGVTLEATKLLVPTPPIYGTKFVYEDIDGDGQYNDGIDVELSTDDNYIIEGKDPNVSFSKGMFQSFNDAPGGFSEELKEVTYSLGAEYLYQDAFAFRLGYFHENETKGARKFFSLGAGFKYNVVNIDLSYLLSTSKVVSPLENTLRFSLSFNIDE